jgi:hypothetical protein
LARARPEAAEDSIDDKLGEVFGAPASRTPSSDAHAYGNPNARELAATRSGYW